MACAPASVSVTGCGPASGVAAGAAWGTAVGAATIAATGAPGRGRFHFERTYVRTPRAATMSTPITAGTMKSGFRAHGRSPGCSGRDA